MKRLITLIFLLLIITLTNCKKNDLGKDTKEVTIWHSYGDNQLTAFNEIVEEYKKETGVKINVQRVSFLGVKEKITTAAISGDTPDIVRIATTEVPFFATGGLLQSFDDFPGIDEHMKKLLPIVKEANSTLINGDENLYGISDQLTSVFLFYNKDIFKKSGILNPPKNIEELYTVGKKVTNRNKGIFGLGLNNSVWWNLPWIYIFNGKIISDDHKKCYLDSPEIINAFKYLAKVTDIENGIEGGAWRSGGIGAEEGFINGKYAMILSGLWLLDKLENVNISYGTSLIPGTGKIKSASNIGGASLTIIKQSKNKIASYKFIKYFTSEKAQRIWCKHTKYNSINKTINNEISKKVDPQSPLAVFIEQLKYAKPAPKIPNYGTLEGSVNPFTYAILDKKMTVEEGLKQAKSFVEKKVISEIQKSKEK